VGGSDHPDSSGPASTVEAGSLAFYGVGYGVSTMVSFQGPVALTWT
jgi:hypothetical protein